jgi:polysaccharide biosynthesis protein PslH
MTLGTKSRSLTTRPLGDEDLTGESAVAGLNFLWVIDFEYKARLHHGAYIRFFNFAPELIKKGHRVIFAVNYLDEATEPSVRYLQQLRAESILTDFVGVNFAAPLWRIWLSARLVYPGLAKPVLRSAQRKSVQQIDEIAAKHRVDVILISSPRFLFVAEETQSGCGCVYDFCDCRSLQISRQMRALLEKRDLASLARSTKVALVTRAWDYYYTRKPIMKILVSPVDKKAVDRMSGKPGTSVVVPNGVSNGAPKGRYSKIPGRLIFTGNMDFPPNYEAALWFLDHVLPLLLCRRQNVCFVIAGANPVSALRNRVSKNVVVTGYVEDLDREIACSEIFVAPLVSGSGFKNKVVEAIVNRTSVVATAMAVEFLDASVQELLSITNSPAGMAEAIMEIWRDPRDAEARAEELRELVTAKYNWASQAAKIVEIAKDSRPIRRRHNWSLSSAENR